MREKLSGYILCLLFLLGDFRHGAAVLAAA